MTSLKDEDDLTAAEFVLGTLDRDEREQAIARIASDTSFAGSVDAWSRRLDALSEGGPEAKPPDHAWSAIIERLGLRAVRQPPAVPEAQVLILRRQVRAWRWTAAAVSALAACLAIVTVFTAFHGAASAPPTMIAVLQRTADTPAFIVKADLSDRTVSARPLDARAPAGRSYELWMIDPSLTAPKSLGTLEGSVPTPRALPAGVTREVASRATYAITDEPAGGSPTGAPSGSPVFVGRLVSDSF